MIRLPRRPACENPIPMSLWIWSHVDFHAPSRNLGAMPRLVALVPTTPVPSQTHMRQLPGCLSLAAQTGQSRNRLGIAHCPLSIVPLCLSLMMHPVPRSHPCLICHCSHAVVSRCCHEPYRLPFVLAFTPSSPIRRQGRPCFIDCSALFRNLSQHHPNAVHYFPFYHHLAPFPPAAGP